jgi:cell division septation protein DedD
LFPTNGPFGGGVSGVFGGKDIKAFVNALQSDSRFKVLSSPSILATDNRPARIQVGTEEPIATGTTTAQVGTPASSTSIQYRNTGRIVTIIPQVNSQGLVNLQILAEVSQKRDKNVTIGADTFPAFDTRQAETTAVVQDGDSLVIGGIITDSKNRTRSGVPYLMDLPIVGRFFSTTSDEAERTELIMLITPHVVRNREDAQQITEAFRNSLATVRNELERMAREKAKLLQSAPPPQPQPAAPGPSGDQPPPPILPQTAPAPAPAPSAAPAPPNASNAPTKTIIFGPAGSPIAADVEELPFQTTGPLREAYEANRIRRNMTDTAQRDDQAAMQPPILALAVKAGAESHPPKIPVKSSLPGSKPGPVWMVQVAAFAHKKDAEVLATNLRALGYDAFTQEAEVDAKLWHRVRVGKTSNQKDALELRKTLTANNKFEQAFVTRQ